MAIVSSSGFLHQAETYIGKIGVVHTHSKLYIIVVSKWKRSHEKKVVSPKRMTELRLQMSWTEAARSLYYGVLLR